MPTGSFSAGTVELVADSVEILNTVTRKLPFLVSAGEAADEEPPREELRLRHRVLDLRCGTLDQAVQTSTPTVASLPTTHGPGIAFTAG